MSSSTKSASANPSSTARYRPETRLVHSGTIRSEFGETSEAMFLTQGYVYDTAEHARPASRAKTPATSIPATPIRRSRCSRSGMRLLEGAEAGRATASGMAAVTPPSSATEGRRPRRGVARALRLLPLHRGEISCRATASRPTLVDGRDLEPWQTRGAAEHASVFFLRDARQSDARGHRPRGRGRDRPRRRRAC